MASRFEIFRGRDGQFYVRLKAAGGEPILASQGYSRKAVAETVVAAIRASAADDARYATRQTTSGYSFVLRAANGEVVGHSEVYSSIAGRCVGIESVKTSAPTAEVDDLT